VVKNKNNEIQKLKDDLAKKSREIHLPYTYKKRYNNIVNENMSGSNYPRARTSAKQEITIGNVLDYLDRVVNEKNELKSQIKNLKKKNRKAVGDKKASINNLSNARVAKNARNFSEKADSEYSVQNSSRKTFDHTKPNNPSSKPIIKK
jgi:hypothetical protein